MTLRSLLVIVLSAVAVSAGAQTPAPTTPSTRVGLALVIGNSKYAGQAQLPTVATDASTMGKALESLGFDVRVVENLEKPRDFEEQLDLLLREKSANSDDMLLVYFSGHGIQFDGKAHLLGTGITTSGDMSASLRAYSENVDVLLERMEQAPPSARVLIVDACRNNAFASAPKKAGVAYQHEVQDTYILFADEPGKTVPARTETSDQSPFTAGLLFAFETLEDGLEKRFEIAKQKTHDLNPDQNPQLLRSDVSAERHRPFLDYGGRSAPTRSAAKLLDEAADLYRAESWAPFRETVRAARVLSADRALSDRLDREMQFADAVLMARAAEAAAGGSKWTDAATAWQKAAALFENRPWLLERAALNWLLADRVQEAVSVLVHLQAYEGHPLADRATRLLAELMRDDPSLESIAKAARSDHRPPSGDEFEVPKP